MVAALYSPFLIVDGGLASLRAEAIMMNTQQMQFTKE
jgi:hypothetical protein